MARVRGYGPRSNRRRRVQRAARRAYLNAHGNGLPQRVGVDDPPGRDRQRLSDGRCDAGRPRAGTFRIVDVNGTLLVIRTTDFPDTSPNELAQGIPDDPTRHAADQVAMQQILDSIRITAAPAQP